MNIFKKEVKCIVWDLDNTIWDGILTEDNNVILKPEIKNILQELDSRGILHSIASKNNYNDAMNKLKEFDLDQYFLYPEIHWNAKSSSILNIQKNINIGLDTIIFCDDQHYERDEVSSACPEVECLDASHYLSLLELDRLNPKFITEDSKRRRSMYLADFQRKKEEENFKGPSEMFLASLQMTFIISEAKEDDLKRAEELTIRTNQLNATGITYDYDELNSFRISEDHSLLVCELIDKYGSYGKIGLALIYLKDQSWYLKLFLMSCRVISRGVGTVFLSHILSEARRSGVKLYADFKKTDRNKMMYISYKFANFKEISSDSDENIIFENDLTIIQKYPSYIDVIIKY